jgi:hypothetical protein
VEEEEKREEKSAVYRIQISFVHLLFKHVLFGVGETFMYQSCVEV